ncbi:hypothetical protein MMC11_005876 [Xylographa trunciseda]|nr:hypothetical protein [Xylographa trunciseda]
MSLRDPIILYDASAMAHRHSIPILIYPAAISTTSAVPPRKATIGGLLRIHGKTYGLTAAHAFAESPGPATDTYSSEAAVFPGSDTDESDSDFANVTMTSHGSVSSGSTSLESFGDPGTDSSPPDSPKPFRTASASSHSEDLDATEAAACPSAPTAALGALAMTSADGASPSLDWALVEITAPLPLRRPRATKAAPRPAATDHRPRLHGALGAASRAPRPRRRLS